MKKALALTVILALLLSAAGLLRVDSARGNAGGIMGLYPTPPSITISSSGDIFSSVLYPSFPQIKRVDDVYYLTGNILHFRITILRDNVTLDGQGFTLLGNIGTGPTAGIGINPQANNITIRNLVVKLFPVGIEPTRHSGSGGFPEGLGTRIINNTISDCNSGIELVGETGNYVSGNVLKNNELSGIHIRNGYANTIQENVIINNAKGIWAEGSYNNFSLNIIAENQNGAYLEDVQANIFTKNNFTRNDCGIYFMRSNDNQFYLNNFLNNSASVGQLSNDLHNSWDDGFVGNYWSNYLGEDLDGDCLADNQFIVSENNTDHYPLMQPFSGYALQSKAFPTAYSMGIVAAIVIVLLGATVYILKRKD